MIKDCINHILEEAQDPDLAHNVSLPLCPAPYLHPYRGDYFNHFDGVDREVSMFDSRKIPLSDKFPGFFRYVSSSEDQEWEVVHSTGARESDGNETIMKLSLERLLYGNSSKITFDWRFKKKGFIRFKYFANADAGNGLAFFINNNQVGGEWNRSSGWQEAKFNVSPGQTYKFDWLVRRQTERSWGKNAIYIKDVECVEVITSLDAPVPPDYDTLGSEAYSDPRFDWITFSKSSVIRTHFDGVVTEGNRERTLVYDMDNECDGEISFAYRMGAALPSSSFEYHLMYVDNLSSRTQEAKGNHDSLARKNHDGHWSGNSDGLSTKANAAKITYELMAADGCVLDARGVVEIKCPDKVVDHYSAEEIFSIQSGGWSRSGKWQQRDGHFVLVNPEEGVSDLTAQVSLQDDGWFTFHYTHVFRPSESLEVLVDGISVSHTNGSYSQTRNIPLTAGEHTITFRVHDFYTEQPLRYDFLRFYTYGESTSGRSFTTESPLGSKAEIIRNWDVTDSEASTFSNGQSIEHIVTLNPGAEFQLDEVVEFYPNPNLREQYYNPVLDEEFNVENVHPNVRFTGPWEWEDIVKRKNPYGSGDGIYKIEGVKGDHTAQTFVNVGRGGYVTFQYGGKYGKYDYMALYANDVLIWKGRESSQLEDTNVKVPLPPGSYMLKWVYHCAADWETLYPETQLPENPYGEVCAVHGNRNYPIAYDTYSDKIFTERGSRYSLSGKSMTPGSSSQVSDKDGAVVERTIYNTSIATTDFSEKLYIEAGRTIAEQGNYPVDFSIERFDQSTMFAGDGYYALDVISVIPPNSVGWRTSSFYADSSLRIKFEYLAFLKDVKYRGNGTNKSGRDTRYRAECFVYLIEEATGKVVERLLNIYENVGVKQQHKQIKDWSKCGVYNIPVSVAPGRYYLKFVLQDVVSDNDRDDENFPYYAAFRGLSMTCKYVRYLPGYDNTRVRVDLVNQKTGKVENSTIYGANGNKSAEYNINFNGLSADTPYSIRYTLLKGKGTTHGINGSGGGFRVSGGVIKEQWQAYCSHNGKYYPLTQSTKHPSSAPSQVQVPPITAPWGWLDLIRVREANFPVCPDTSVRVTVREGNKLISSREWRNSGELTTTSVKNTSDTVQTYVVRQEFHSSCGDGAALRKGRIIFRDVSLLEPSSVTLSAFSVIDNHPVYKGGCDGSSVKVKVTDEKGTVIKDFGDFYNEGWHGFYVSDLPNRPYSKYKIEIETNQRGSGQYLTTFSLLDFRVFEKWANIPDPFNGKLDFYIDGELKGTYKNVNQTLTVNHPLPKGKHDLKWVFTELGSGNSYDFCDLDLIKSTNWICDSVKVVPYCDPGGGDKCVEELIKCLLKLWNDRPKACMIGRKAWLFT
ncbi:hypothetical protein [Paenibacillus sp. NPDC058071]|uniref:hypothetical protein n=1 Tax=Paenibacillus sp. NPDC058071 TaxID=3346326 RepID=UPI0036DBB197